MFISSFSDYFALFIYKYNEQEVMM